MGNRATIVSNNKTDLQSAIYLHWNGGRSSVEAFLAYAKAKGVRGASYDNEYCMARLAQIIGNFFGGTNSVGIIPYDPIRDREMEALDVGDNGIYIIDNDFNIVGRKGVKYEDDEKYNFEEFIRELDARQSEHLPSEKLEEAIKLHRLHKEV